MTDDVVFAYLIGGSLWAAMWLVVRGDSGPDRGRRRGASSMVLATPVWPVAAVLLSAIAVWAFVAALIDDVRVDR